MKTLNKLISIYLACFLFVAVIISVVIYSVNQLPASQEAITINTTLYILSAIGLLGFLTGLIFINHIYRKNISNPLDRITSTARQVKEGRLETFPLIKTGEMRALMENIYSIERILNDKKEELANTFSREKNVLRTLNLLNDLNKTLLSKAMVYEFLEIILSSSTKIIKSEVGAIALLDRTNNQVTHFISNPAQHAGDAKTIAKRIVSELIDSRKPVLINAASGEKLLAGIEEKTTMKVNTVLAVPILVENEILGGLIFINKSGNGVGSFTMDNKTHAIFISYQAAMAIEKSLIQEALLRSEKTDKLTGLDNHLSFHEKLHIEIKRAERFSHTLSVMFINIDFLKRFNDTYGKQNGDTAIKEISKILKGDLRRIDTAARYGGEAFTIILPETSVDGALQSAERIKRDIGTHPFVVHDQLMNLTVSIGVSVYPQDAVQKEDLIEAAETALHRAKKTGRNKVISFRQYIEEKERDEERKRLEQMEEQQGQTPTDRADT